MIWLASLFSQLLFGFELSFFAFSSKFDFFTIFCIGIPIGFSLSSLVFYLLSFFFRFNSLCLLVHTGALGFIGYTLEFFRWRKKQQLFQKKTEKSYVFYFILSIALALFIVPPMYFPKSKDPKDKFLYAHQSFSGDIIEEIGLMNSFYHGCNSGFMNLFKIRHPVCHKCHARSKWLTALHSAMFLVGYSSYRQALVVPSIFMFLSICYLMLHLSSLFLRNNVFLSVATLFLFLFLGGLGFTRWLQSSSRNNPDVDFVFQLGPVQTEWSHPLFHYIFALRPSQLSLSLILSMLIIITEINPLGPIDMAALGIIVGILPAIQHQVFISAIIFLIAYWVITLPFLRGKRQNRQNIQNIGTYILKYYGTFLLSFGIISFFPLIHYLPRANRYQMIFRNDFWDSLTEQGRFFAPIQVWFDALGFFPLFTLFLCWFTIYRNKKLLHIYIPSLFIFIIANHYRFQPYIRQNIVVFYPFWIISASIVFIYTVSKFSKMPKSEEAQGVLIGLFGFLYLCSIWSSVLGYYRLRNRKIQAWNDEMMTMANWISENTPIKAVFISSTTDFDIVSVLAGKVSCIHNQRLAWIEGFNPIQKEEQISSLLHGSNSQLLLPKVKYVLRYNNDNNRRFDQLKEENWTKIYSTENFILYQRKS